MQYAIKFLSRLLYREFGNPVYIIIDEYDVPLQNAYVEGFYDDAIKFFKAFYGITFKDNQYMEKTVLTGVSRAAKESIFSDANSFIMEFKVFKQDKEKDIEETIANAKKQIEEKNMRFL